MNQDDFEAHFARLNEHLQEVRPVFDDFCAQHGFSYVNRKALGRYPRIRIDKAGAVTIWFDLWMELDDGGHRFTEFSRDLPYELAAGAHAVVPDASKYGIRFQKAIQCFAHKPFCEVGSILRSEMEKYLPIVEQWDLQYLKDHGTRIQLGT